MDIAPADDARATASPTGAEEADCSADAPASIADKTLGVGLLPQALRTELWVRAGAEAAEVTDVEFGAALEAIGAKHNFSLEPGRRANEKEREKFWRSLHLEDLALAQACAMGREAAWQRFMSLYQGPLSKAAAGIAGSVARGEELASALYAELCGVTERGLSRRSPLERYSGRGSMMGWLRAILAQRQVDEYRRTRKETPLEDTEPVTAETAHPETETIAHLQAGVQSALKGLDAEERFLLSAYFLDGHTLAEVGRVLGVHEATISRKLNRSTKHVRKELLRALQARGLSRRAAEEALGTDPRDVEVNLRKLLQRPQNKTYSDMEGRV